MVSYVSNCVDVYIMIMCVSCLLNWCLYLHVHYVCIIVQRFYPQSKRFRNVHYYYYYQPILELMIQFKFLFWSLK